LLTITEAVPSAAVGGVKQLRIVDERKRFLASSCVLSSKAKITVDAELNPSPVMRTSVSPACGPLEGSIAITLTSA
jgi:hypothetical protein